MYTPPTKYSPDGPPLSLHDALPIDRGVVRLRPPGGSVNKGIIAAAAAIVFVCGIGVGYSAKPAPALALYHGKTDQEAARGLLELALEQAEDGSWERIGVARVYYLGGFKAEGQAIFDEVLAGKHDDGDAYRIARVYREAGGRGKDRGTFRSSLAANPDDSRALSERGGYHLPPG